MASALEAVFLQESTSQEQSILQDLHDRYPLNLNAHKVSQSEHADLTERMRLRKAKAALEENGIKVSGAEQAQTCANWQVSFRGHFNQHGNLKGNLQITIDQEGGDNSKTREELLQITQMVLNGWGFASIVNRSEKIVAFKEGILAERVGWVELGLHERGVEGMTPEEAEKWIATDEVFADTSILNGWKESGLGLSEAKIWLVLEIEDYRGYMYKPWSSAHMVKDWKDAGFDFERASHWGRLHHRMSSYSYARSWIDSGMTPGEAKKWLALIGDNPYGNSFGVIKDLRAAGIKPEHALEVGQGGVRAIDLASLIDWAKDEGVKMSQLIEWCRLQELLGGVHQFKYWYREGFTPEQAEAWCGLGNKWGRYNPFHQPHQAKEWEDAGLEPKDAKPWVGIHRNLASYSTVQAWKEAGYGPSDVKPWAEIAANTRVGSHFLYPRVIGEWQDLHPKLCNPKVVERLVGAGVSLSQAEAMIDAFDLV